MLITVVSRASAHSHQCSSYQGVYVAASVQTYGSVSAHVGQNHEVCLSAHGCFTQDTIITDIQTCLHSHNIVHTLITDNHTHMQIHTYTHLSTHTQTHTYIQTHMHTHRHSHKPSGCELIKLSVCSYTLSASPNQGIYL